MKKLTAWALLLCLVLVSGVPALADEYAAWLEKNGLKAIVTPTAVLLPGANPELVEILQEPDANKAGGFTFHLESAVGKEKADEYKASLGRGVSVSGPDGWPYYWGLGRNWYNSSSSSLTLARLREIIKRHDSRTAIDMFGRNYTEGDVTYRIVSEITWFGSYKDADIWTFTARTTETPSTTKQIEITVPFDT